MEAGILVCYERTLDEDVSHALRASVERLELPIESLCFVDFSQVDSSNIYELIESLDPYMILSVHEACARVLEELYRCDVPMFESVSLQGRATRNLGNMHELLSDPAQKQLIWASLKSLTASRL